MSRWVTFLSDYGLSDAFVGVCHGVIAGVAEQRGVEVRVLDVSHGIVAQDLEHGAVALAGAVPFLPAGGRDGAPPTVHLALVDPVGRTSARPVAVATASGPILVGPDNGLLGPAVAVLGGVAEARELASRSLWLPQPHRMFRGRDIFAPVAAHLAAGTALADVGPLVDPASLETVTLRQPTIDDDHVHGEVRSIDHFGNIALNVRRSDLEAAGIVLGDPVELRVGGRSMQVPFALSYGEVAHGRVALCEDALRMITVAVNFGSAEATLRVRRGDPLVLARVPVQPAPDPTVRVGVFDPPVRVAH